MRAFLIIVLLTFCGTFSEPAFARKEKPAPATVYGRIQFVTTFPDVKVKVVKSFADLRVQKVTSFATSAGKWEIVDSFPDFKVEIVEAFEDFTIEYVDSFPGVKK